MITTINPTTEIPIDHYTEMGYAQLEDIIEQTHKAFLAWRKTSFAERSKVLQKMAQLLRKNVYTYASLLTKEMGKPIVQARSEIEKCAWACEYFAEHANHYLKSRDIKTEMQKSYVCYQPLGVIFAIMPWNFPFWQVYRFAAPGLMAGNAVLLKHAPNTTGCGLLIEKLWREAGLPENLFRTVILDNDTAAKAIAHPLITGVTLTGSVKAGKTVAAIAGKYLKKTVLELGGSDPYIILEDADIEIAADACVAGRLLNSGQSCIAAKRWLVAAKIKEEFLACVLKKITAYQMNDPQNENTKLGPMARKDLREQLHKQIEDSIAKGAKLICGGEIPNQKGYFYPVTMLTDIKKSMPAYREELFGPAISLFEFTQLDDAIKIANDTEYGLGAAIFTKNIKLVQEIAETEIFSGSVAINSFLASDPRLPFGGIKHSGYGRELSEEGIREFTNVKSIIVKSQSDNKMPAAK